ncbi:dihydrodipicolinate synthase family protein [Sphingomonas sp. CJ20]
MPSPINGVIPVMITPFTDDDRIDYAGLERLIDWYLANGADALFAVCLSSEMYLLSPQERRELGRFVVQSVAGRVPVVVSGHVSDDEADQAADLRAAADSGADAVILITNRLDGAGDTLLARTRRLMAGLPADLSLGLYECPAPRRRLLSDDELRALADAGRFVLLKDVSCDLETVRRRLGIVAGTPLAISNANAAIAYPAMQAGARGFCGILANFCPDLYAWLLRHGAAHPALAQEVATTLVLASMGEAFGYPALAKLYHQRLGTFASAHSRAQPGNIRARIWGIDPLLDAIAAAIDSARARVAALTPGG